MTELMRRLQEAAMDHGGTALGDVLTAALSALAAQPAEIGASQPGAWDEFCSEQRAINADDHRRADRITVERETLRQLYNELEGVEYEFDPPKRVLVLMDELRAALAAQPATSADYALGYAEGFNDACKPAQPVEPVACPRGHVWHDFGQLGGRNVSWCPRCDTLAFTGQEPPAAPGAEPLDSIHAELWRLAVRKGVVTVESKLIDDRNPNTRCSWMQGNDKACDISNDAAKVAGDNPAPAAAQPAEPLWHNECADRAQVKE